MSAIEEAVLNQLSKFPELNRIERGYVHQVERGETRIFFRPTTKIATDLGLCATAIIESTFGEYFSSIDDESLARLNRRSCHGGFFTESGRLGIRASFCIYEKEPAEHLVSMLLLQAMGEQLALGFATAHTEWAPETLPGNRANLEFPRKWAQPPSMAHFEASVQRFNERGFVSTLGDHGIVLEVPLADGPRSIMIDRSAETALLHVSIDVPHPLAGVGYLATIALPIDPSRESIPGWCNRLNEEENQMQDFVPRFGAWAARGAGSELVYSMFWPSDRANEGLEATIMTWLVVRTLWLRDRYWSPGKGLVRDSIRG